MSQTERQPTVSDRRSGFTLVELLVVIGLIVVLISILVPVVSHVRTAAQSSSTQAFIAHLGTVIDAYNADFHSYPGPLSNDEVYNRNPSAFWIAGSSFPNGFIPDPVPDFDITTGADLTTNVTMSENLVLGLLGGLHIVAAATPSGILYYNPAMVGLGPNSLNQTGATKRSAPYMEAKNLSWRTTSTGKTGQYKDDAGTALDTMIPEFVDNYTDPMPILYLRAKKGAVAAPGGYTNLNNAIITYDPSNSPANEVGQYDLHQIIGYTATTIGVGRKQYVDNGWTDKSFPHGIRPDSSDPVGIDKPLSGEVLYTAYAYFRNPTLSSPTLPVGDTTTPRVEVPWQKDSYILISAGADRVYGTADDITNFGGVGK